MGVVGYPNKDRHGDLHDQPCIISLVFEYEMDRQHPGKQECNNIVDHRWDNIPEIQGLWKSNGFELCDAGMAVMVYAVTGLSVNRGF